MRSFHSSAAFVALAAASLLVPQSCEAAAAAFARGRSTCTSTRHPPCGPTMKQTLAIAYPPAKSTDTRNAVLWNNKNKSKTDSGLQPRTVVKDGSPLGVAIVLLGGFYGMCNDSSDEQLSVWAVFATASIAAGISRFVKFSTKKK
mmetsp:Transcript_19528/g.39565  ORF Transcript_19528/g.39565 Transcript_19528/m.39565 type:complete len:145 (+) Transcript_19528:722-1156(+)